MVVEHDGGVAADLRSGDGAKSVYVDGRAKCKYISVPGLSWLSKDGWEMQVVREGEVEGDTALFYAIRERYCVILFNLHHLIEHSLGTDTCGVE